MRIVIGLILAFVGVVLIAFRKHVGPPPNIGPPHPGTKAHQSWTSYTRMGGVLVGITMVFIGGLYAARIIG
jgi:drug/metabolite transporter (DMT)-like permease